MVDTKQPCNCPPEPAGALVPGQPPPLGAIATALQELAAGGLPPLGALHGALAAVAPPLSAAPVTVSPAPVAPGQPATGVNASGLEGLLAVARANPGLKITLSY